MPEKFKDQTYMNLFLAALSGATANQLYGADVAHAVAEDVADLAFARATGSVYYKSAKDIRSEVKARHAS